MAEKARPKPKKKVVKTELESLKSGSTQEEVVEKVNIEETVIPPFPSAVKSSTSSVEIVKDISQPISPNKEDIKPPLSLKLFRIKRENKPSLQKLILKFPTIAAFHVIVDFLQWTEG